jgi:hypothetical protein
MRAALLFLAALALVGSPSVSEAQIVALNRFATWKYWDKGAIADTNWFAASYGDSTWASGPTAMGYVCWLT